MELLFIYKLSITLSVAGNNVHFPGKVAQPKDPCYEVIQSSDEIPGSGYYTINLATRNTSLECYPRVFDAKHRFIITTIILLLPLTLYFFELLR